MTNERTIHEPLFHISKREVSVWWKPIIVRAIAIVLGLFSGLMFAWAYTGVNPFTLLLYMVDGVFGTERRIWTMLQNLSLLLLVSIAVVPAFKMKFWNIGADGQVLMGCLASATMIYYFYDKVSLGVLLVLMFSASVLAGMLWAVIPAIFKAKWNTNETLFTLMANYIATQLVSFVLLCWFPSGQNDFAKFYYKYGNFPILGNRYVVLLLFAVVLTVFMFVYLKKTKHGYEVSLVGESVNTARYVGINVRKVITRTLLLSGAICGLTGFLLVSAKDHALTTTMVSNRGFTAIIVVWLAKFNPIYMVLTSFMVVFLNRGTAQILSKTNITNSALSDIITAMVFFFIIGCEFFIVYTVKFRKKKPNGKEKAGESVAEVSETESNKKEEVK